VQIKTPAKLNIFLKIVGFRGDYHLIRSRFIRYDSLFDTITLIPESGNGLRIEGIEIPLEANILTQVYHRLRQRFPQIEPFFQAHKISIQKRIPMGSGLGGGSSNAAGLIKLLNQVLDLGMDLEEMAQLGATIGADVPFFIYDYPAANVEGIGERITPVDDSIPPLALHFPGIECNTKAVYTKWRQTFPGSFDLDLAHELSQMTSKEILATIAPLQANDLFGSAMKLCPELAPYPEAGYYLSGSGSTLFRSADEGDRHQQEGLPRLRDPR